MKVKGEEDVRKEPIRGQRGVSQTTSHIKLFSILHAQSGQTVWKSVDFRSLRGSRNVDEFTSLRPAQLDIRRSDDAGVGEQIMADAEDQREAYLTVDRGRQREL